MKKILLFGGTGGLGKQVITNLQSDYKCVSIGSKDCDVTDYSQVKSYLESVDFDCIVYLSVKNIDGLIHKQSHENIKLQLDVNIIGLLNVMKYSTEKMRKNDFGRFIYISSVLSSKPIRGTGLYSASKAFGDNLIKTFSLENSKYGITANSIQLGYFDGGLTEKVPENILTSVINKIPLKRLGFVSEISNLISCIIENEYINGTTISITGGYENE